MGSLPIFVLAGAVAGTPSALEVHRADLGAEVLARLDELGPASPEVLLDAVLRLEPPYRFEVGPLAVETDRRWYRSPESPEEGGPLMDLRRWPGDTALLCYVRARRSGQGVPFPGSFASCPARGDWLCQHGQLETPAGSRRAVWVERPAGSARLGCLLVPGDAGLGPAAPAALERELWVLVERMELDLEGLDSLGAVAAEPTGVPDLGFPPGADDERREPWQVAMGFDFTLGLPPGVRSHWMHDALPIPNGVPGGLLWFRGRFVDAKGTRVVIGDGSRAGYVAQVEPDESWRTGTSAPRGAPGARRVRAVAFEPAVELTRATEARAERWREEAFAGEWLVFRLLLPGRGIEIGLPVLEGRQSESLFWIPLTFREYDEPPAPPPIDPARQFGMGFERLSGASRRRNPWIEGYFEAPGLRIEVPAGWWPVVHLRSRDGYPVRFVDRQGHERAVLERLAAPPEPSGEDWQVLERPGRFNARQVLRREDGTHVWVAAEGHAFLLRPGADAPSPEVWGRLLDGIALRPRP